MTWGAFWQTDSGGRCCGQEIVGIPLCALPGIGPNHGTKSVTRGCGTSTVIITGLPDKLTRGTVAVVVGCIIPSCFRGHRFPWTNGPALLTIQYNITLLPSVNTLTARGMFCGAKYTHHTFTPIIKHIITTTANKHPDKKSYIDKNVRKSH